VRKRELHVTLAGTRDRCDGAALRDAAQGIEFRITPTERYLLVRKGAQRAIIMLVQVEGQEDYCTRLDAALGLPCGTVSRMPSHITLYTEPGGRGIALYSPQEMKSLSTETKLKIEPAPWRLDEGGAILGA